MSDELGRYAPFELKLGAFGAIIKAQRHEVPTSNLKAKRPQSYLT
jgi:hypothetical protein